MLVNEPYPVQCNVSALKLHD